MAQLRLLVSVCTVAVLAGAAVHRNPTLTWTISPNPPEAGETLTVNVTAAPSTPVKVEVYVGGQLIHSASLFTLPGSTECDIDVDDEGEEYEVIVTSGAEQEEKTGTIAP